MDLGYFPLLFWLAPKFLLEDRVGEDRIFLEFLIVGVAGQVLFWLYAHRMTRTYVWKLGFDQT